MCETLEETRSTKFSQEKSPTYLNTFFIHQHSTPDRSSVAPFMPAADAEIIELKSYAAAWLQFIHRVSKKTVPTYFSQ